MSKKRKRSNSPDKPENQDLPVDAEQVPSAGKPKRKRSHKNVNVSPIVDQDQKEQSAPQIEEQAPTDDDLLADIRRSLKEEDAAKRGKKEKGIIQRVSRLIKPGKVSQTVEPKVEEPKPVEAEPPPIVEDIPETIIDTAVISSSEENVPVAEADITSRLDAESESIAITPEEQFVASIIPDLELGEPIPEKPQAEAIPQPEPEIAEEPRGSEVLRAQPEEEKSSEDFETIREVALEGYDESPHPQEESPAVPLRQRFKIFRRGLRPIDRTMILGVLILIFTVGAASFGFKLINAQTSAETPAPTQDLPVPIRVTLPGGWDFKLTKGKVEDGSWSPKGAEWLEGTELCRWVALPWSLQLEAVVRTLKSNDPIELTMSNADPLKFKVQSIRNVSVDQIGTLEKKTVCLLLILVNKDEDTRWVVTAIP